jgi:Uma2 family endonuclease
MYAKTKKYTYEDYSRLEEGAPYQLIDGELIMSPPPTVYHQQILLKISILLSNYLEKNKIGFVLTSPMDVYFDKHETYQPDIIFISNARKKIIGEKKIEGAPDLVIEILSESSAYYELNHKKTIYERYNVKEYWIVDPIDKTVEVYENKDGSFTIFNKVKEKGEIKSKIFREAGLKLKNIF